MNDFHVILPSNTNNNNSANNYTTTLDKHIDLSEGKWCVGLSDISFYKNNVTLTKGCGFELIINDSNYVEKSAQFGLTSDKDTYVFGHYIIYKDEKSIYIARDYCDSSTIREFTVSFVSDIERVKSWLILDDDKTKDIACETQPWNNDGIFASTRFFSRYKHDIKDDRRPYHAEEKKSECLNELKEHCIDRFNHDWKYSFPIHEFRLQPENNSKEPLILYIKERHDIKSYRYEFDHFVHVNNTEELIEKLDFLFVMKGELFIRNRFVPTWNVDKDGRINLQLTKSIKQIRFLGGLHFVLGFTNDNYYIKNITTDYPPQLRRGVGSMYVYCNICSETRVGDTFVPLLRQIVLQPLTKPDEIRGMIEVITLDSPMYVPVKLTTINNIEIEVRTNIGDYFPFLEGSVTTITLHFKRYE